MNQFDRLFSLSGLSLDRLRSFLQVAEAGNLSKAAQGDPTRQSQFSRQIKELEAFFGVALTRRVGRRIEITDEGRRLAMLIHQQFRELDDFRESMNGRGITLRVGSLGSIIHWLLLPRMEAIRSTLGGALVEIEQMRTLDVMRAVSDGRLDFGILREDAVPGEQKRWPIGTVGYSLFVAKALCRKERSISEVVTELPMAELLLGGQFSRRLQEWHEKEGNQPRVSCRVSSFVELARIVAGGQAAAVLPDLAAEELPADRFRQIPVKGLEARRLVLIGNERALERSGLPETTLTGFRDVVVAAGIA